MKQKNPQRTEHQMVTADMLRMLYERPSQLRHKDGQPFEAPVDGAIGLLALGHIGLVEWRKSKKKHFTEKKKTNN